MFKVTKNAATRILEAAQAGEMEGLALRLAPYYKSDGSIEYNKMGFDEIKENDIRIEAQGINIVFAPEYKELLNEATMDFVEIETGNFSYIFLNPNDHNYVPSKEEGKND
ncbi:MAG: Fe-S cluster assembly protein HesB [Thiomargarita sp.]|nr:Fe-S cluster assembly protein HesB [Thiomargarita sp.]